MRRKAASKRTYKKRTYKRTYKRRPVVKRVYKRSGMSARQKYVFAQTGAALQGALQRVKELESTYEDTKRRKYNTVMEELNRRLDDSFFDEN